MTLMRRLVSISLAVGMMMVLMTGVAFAQDPANGQLVWEEETGCQRCHGAAGEGEWAGPLAGTSDTAQEWIDQVRTPRRNMPAFSAEQVSDQQIIDMQAYMASLTAPADFSRIDAGLPADAPQGQQLLVEKRCAACHSTNGPINGFIERGEIPTTEDVLMQVRTPRRNMPSYRDDQISDAEVALITDFMAQQVSSQVAPATLPTSGSSQSPAWPVMLLLAGSVALLGGYTLRRLAR